MVVDDYELGNNGTYSSGPTDDTTDCAINRTTRLIDGDRRIKG